MDQPRLGKSLASGTLGAPPLGRMERLGVKSRGRMQNQKGILETKCFQKPDEETDPTSFKRVSRERGSESQNQGW